MGGPGRAVFAWPRAVAPPGDRAPPHCPDALAESPSAFRPRRVGPRVDHDDERPVVIHRPGDHPRAPSRGLTRQPTIFHPGLRRRRRSNAVVGAGVLIGWSLPRRRSRAASPTGRVRMVSPWSPVVFMRCAPDCAPETVLRPLYPYQHRARAVRPALLQESGAGEHRDPPWADGDALRPLRAPGVTQTLTSRRLRGPSRAGCRSPGLRRGHVGGRNTDARHQARPGDRSGDEGRSSGDQGTRHPPAGRRARVGPRASHRTPDGRRAR